MLRAHSSSNVPAASSTESKGKVKFNDFIVRLKVYQRTGPLSLPQLGIFAIHPRYFIVFFNKTDLYSTIKVADVETWWTAQSTLVPFRHPALNFVLYYARIPRIPCIPFWWVSIPAFLLFHSDEPAFGGRPSVTWSPFDHNKRSTASLSVTVHQIVERETWRRKAVSD